MVVDITGYFGDQYGGGGLSFYPLTPTNNIYDSLNTVAGNFGIGETRTIVANTYANEDYIPATVKAILYGVEVQPDSGLGFLTAWPTGITRPLASLMNDNTTYSLLNAGIIPTGTDQLPTGIQIYTSSATRVRLNGLGIFE